MNLISHSVIADAAVQIFVGIVIAAIASMITVRLSLVRFRSERWWEKRVAAYERVIEALHEAKQFSSKHLEAEHNSHELANELQDEMMKRATQAGAEVKRASDIGTFLLSPEAIKILERFETESGQLSNCQSWDEYLEREHSLTDRCMKEFIAKARKDLKR